MKRLLIYNLKWIAILTETEDVEFGVVDSHNVVAPADTNPEVIPLLKE